MQAGAILPNKEKEIPALLNDPGDIEVETSYTSKSMQTGNMAIVSEQSIAELHKPAESITESEVLRFEQQLEKKDNELLALRAKLREALNQSSTVPMVLTPAALHLTRKIDCIESSKDDAEEIETQHPPVSWRQRMVKHDRVKELMLSLNHEREQNIMLTIETNDLNQRIHQLSKLLNEKNEIDKEKLVAHSHIENFGQLEPNITKRQSAEHYWYGCGICQRDLQEARKRIHELETSKV